MILSMPSGKGALQLAQAGTQRTVEAGLMEDFGPTALLN
jgi:hypothetical protein